MGLPLRTLGQFKTIDLLQNGVLCEVYKGIDLVNGVPCILKFAKGNDSTIEERALEREIDVLKNRIHPSFPKLLGYQLKNRPIFTATEFISGPTIRDLLRQEFSLKTSIAIAIIRQVLEALIPLHQIGMNHGDIKPENIIVEHGSRARLIDFGYSTSDKEMVCHPSLTGTPNYMAPEICSTQPRNGSATDLFSLGVLGFEMLTGFLPYPTGNLVETINRHKNDPLSGRLDWHGRDISGVENLVAKMLSFQAEKRGNSKALLKMVTTIEIQQLVKKQLAG